VSADDRREADPQSNIEASSPDNAAVDSGEPQPESSRFFYGWVIVAVMGASGAVSMAMGSLNFGLFIKPMGDSLNIGRSWFGWAQTARQVASSFTSAMVGKRIDRYGSRVMLPVDAFVTGCAMVGLSLMDDANDAWLMVALFAVMGLVGMSGPGAVAASRPSPTWSSAARRESLSTNWSYICAWA